MLRRVLEKQDIFRYLDSEPVHFRLKSTAVPLATTAIISANPVRKMCSTPSISWCMKWIGNSDDVVICFGAFYQNRSGDGVLLKGWQYEYTTEIWSLSKRKMAISQPWSTYLFPSVMFSRISILFWWPLRRSSCPDNPAGVTDAERFPSFLYRPWLSVYLISGAYHVPSGPSGVLARELLMLIPLWQ